MRWLALASSIACTTAYTAAQRTHSIVLDHLGFERSKDHLWYLGVLLEVLTTFLGIAGEQLWRLAALVAPGALSSALRSPRALYLYVAGVVLIIFELPLEGFAFTLAPYSVLSACAGLGVAWNVILAPCLLGEQLTMVRTSAAAAIVVGTILSGVFGPHQEVRTCSRAHGYRRRLPACASLCACPESNS
jgi:hypothetical protein